jgi:hypothetical protein
MENFSITTQLTTKEFAKVMIIGLYKKPGMIFATILGSYYIITILLDSFKIVTLYEGIPYFETAIGFFLLFAPVIVTLIAVKQFNSNVSFKNGIKYTFNDEGIMVEASTFKSNLSWNHIVKTKEIRNFLLLYHSKNSGNYIDKTKLNQHQLEFIKSQVSQKQ